MPNGMFIDHYLDSMTPPIFEGRPSNFTGPFNMNLMGYPGGQGTMMAMPFMAPMLQQMMGREGMLPAQFIPTQNLYDQFKSAQTFQGYQKAMQQAAQTDAQTYEKMFQGIARMTDTPWGLRQQQASATMSKDIAALAPLLSQLAPELFDQMHGARGSATLMAQVLHRTGRHSLDPVTGRVGLSGSTAGTLSQEIFQQLYGPGVDIASMRGIGAGEGAMLYEQLLQRGMGSPSIGRMHAVDRVRNLANMNLDDAAIQRIADRAGVGVDDIRGTQEKLRSMEVDGKGADFQQLDQMAGVDDMMRTFDAGRVGNRMKDLAGVVSAMRDIFGDMGRPDAPMREIIAGLEALTQGGLATMSPAVLESMVHETRILAKQAGASMDAVFGLTAQAASMTDAYGLDRSFALQSTQSALAFGQATGISGRLDMPAWGSLDRDRATLLHQRLMLAGAASPAGNQLGAVMRLADQGVLPERDAQGNITNAGRLAQALRAGQSTFEYLDPATGQTRQRSVVMGYGEFNAMLQQSGMTAQDAGDALRARHANQEYTQRYGIGDIVREGQADYDGERMISAAMQGTLLQSARGMGGTPQEQLALARAVAGDVAKQIQDLDPEVYRDTGSRNTAIAKSIQEAFAARVRSNALAAGKDAAGAEADVQAALASLGPVGDDGVRERARSMAVNGWGAFDQLMSKTGYTSGVGYLQLQGDTVKETAAAVRSEARTEAQLAQALSGMGHSPLRRMADVIMDSKADDSLERVVAKALGAVDIKELQEKDVLVRGFAAAQQQFHTAARKDGLLTKEGSAQRDVAARALEAMTQGGERVDRWLLSMQTQFGIKGDRVQADNLRKAIEASALPASEKERLLAMVTAVDSSREGTLRKRIEELGYGVDRQLSAEDLDQTASRGENARSLLAGLVAPKDREAWQKTEAYGRAARVTDKFLSSSEDRLSVLMGSTKDMEQLGKGGLAMVQGLEAKHRSLQLLADQAGVSVKDLLTGNVDPKHLSLVKDARKIQGQMTDDWTAISKRSMGPLPTKGEAMTATERAMLEAEQKFRRMPGKPSEVAQSQAEQLADELAKMVGGDKRTALKAGRDEIVDAILDGDRQLPVFRAVQARKTALEMAKKYKLIGEKDMDSLEAQRAALGKLGGADLSKEDREAWQQLQRLMDPLKTVGSESGDESAEIAELLRTRYAGAKPADPKDVAKKEQVVTGTLKLVGLDKVLLQGHMAGNSVDMAPVAVENNRGPQFIG